MNHAMRGNSSHPEANACHRRAIGAFSQLSTAAVGAQ
jgi:hypothetical protein